MGDDYKRIAHSFNTAARCGDRTLPRRSRSPSHLGAPTLCGTMFYLISCAALMALRCFSFERGKSG